MSIDNTEDVIDSREVIERIAELETEAEQEWELQTFGEDADTESLPDLPQDFDHAAYLDEDDAAELRALRELASDGEGLSDWQYGETLIRDSYFEDYARELADEIGAVDSNAGWPNSCIDWEKAARELQMDYTSIEFDGVTYWARG